MRPCPIAARPAPPLPLHAAVSRWAHAEGTGGGERPMDLTKDVPRSPYETLGGIVFLPRAIDKMRALIAGALGEYNARFGTSERMFRVLFGLTADDFEQIVRERPTDEGVLGALRRRALLTPEQIEDWNELAIN